MEHCMEMSSDRIPRRREWIGADGEAPWLEAERREAAWDAFVSRRPVCADCGSPILSEQCLPVEAGVICPACIRRRMVDTEDAAG